MPTLRDLLEPIISTAVIQAVDAYRQMLLAEGGAAAPVKKKLGRPPGAKNKVHAAAPVVARPGATKDPRQLANEQAAAAVLAFITASPGLRGEQIAKGMAGTSTTVNKALAKLRDKKQVKTKGNRRGTTYYPVGAVTLGQKVETAAPPARAPAKTKKRKKGAHRTKAQIAASDARVLAFIKASPGLRTEQIVKGLGGDDSGDVSFALAHLRGAKKVRARGYGRWTVYST